MSFTPHAYQIRTLYEIIYIHYIQMIEKLKEIEYICLKIIAFKFTRIIFEIHKKENENTSYTTNSELYIL